MMPRRARSGAVLATLVVALVLDPRNVRAEDECGSDEDCVELYADGFVCASGSLGRYCVERGCVSDADCREEYGPDSWCTSWGSESRCEVPSPPKYVPPFRSMCSAVPCARATSSAWLGLGLLVLAGTALGRRRP